MDSHYQKTLTATEFKAKCLVLMDQLASGQLKRIIITKRGKQVACLLPSPVDADSVVPRDQFWGAMKDVTLVPEDFDLTQPLFSNDELNEFGL
jgi:antitoxin (DNA-binding transcriptional repressor) of toxin-antitoxin stability system